MGERGFSMVMHMALLQRNNAERAECWADSGLPRQSNGVSGQNQRAFD